MDSEMKPFHGQCKPKKDIGPVYWKMENCMIKRGYLCELTGEYHWKSLVSCHSCDNCDVMGGVGSYKPRSDLKTFYATNKK